MNNKIAEIRDYARYKFYESDMRRAQEDVLYLLSELERVQREREQLEFVYEDCKNLCILLQEENKQIEEERDKAIEEREILLAAGEAVDILHEQNLKLIEGLRWYEYYANWIGIERCESVINKDRGDKARSILSELGIET